MQIAERIKKYRYENGLTQGGLAREVGVVQMSVSRWERGLPISDPMADRLIRAGIIHFEDDPEKWFAPEEIEFIAKNHNRLNVIGLAKALDAEYDKVLAAVSKIKEEKIPMYDPENGEIQVGELFYHKGYKVALVRKIDGLGVFFDQESATAFRAPLSFADEADGVKRKRVVKGSILSRKVQGHLNTNFASRFAMLKGTRLEVSQLRAFEDGVSAGSEVLIKTLAKTFNVDTRTILHWARTKA